MPFERQTEQALFQDLLWSMPERRQQRPAVLIVGGHSQSLQAPLQAFAELSRYELETSILLPDSLKSSLGHMADNVAFAASTPAGSFALGGLTAALELAKQHQCLFIVGDLSANQETQQFIDQLLRRHAGCKLVSGKIVKRLLAKARPAGLNLVLAANQLPSFSRLVGKDRAWRANLSSEAFGELIYGWQLDLNFSCCWAGHIWTKAGRQVCATATGQNSVTEPQLAAACAYFLSLAPTKPWQALVSAAWHLKSHAG